MTDDKAKRLKLTKAERQLYELQCLGQCTTCYLDGCCSLQDKLKRGKIK